MMRVTVTSLLLILGISCSAASAIDCEPVLIQQHFHEYGSKFFDRSWADYRAGFGDASGNYWIGNDRLSQLTMTDRYKLRFDLQPRGHSEWYVAEYRTFRVMPEHFNYRLHVHGFSGNASSDAFGQHDGMMFSTKDNDNDLASPKHYPSNCAASFEGGFWYAHCLHCCVTCSRSSFFFWRALPGYRLLQTSRMWLQCK